MKKVSCLALVVLLLSACGSTEPQPTESVDPPTPVVNSVTIDRETLELDVGGTAQLNASVEATGGAAESVIWNSSNEDVAIVNETGRVTAVGVGEAIITATSTFDPTKSDSAVVTVSTNPTDPTAPDLRGQLAGWSGGEVTLNAVFYGAAGSKAEVATGEVGADGKLEIFLNKDVPGDFLTELTACQGLTRPESSVRQNAFSVLEVTQGTTVVGRAALASEQSVLTEGLQAVGDYYVQQTYADAGTTLQGSCSLGGAVDAVFKYDLKLNRGWNAVTFELVGENGDAQTLELSSGTPQGAAWFFAPVP